MESVLFSYDNYEFFSELGIQFYNCTLKQRIGNFNQYDVISIISINYWEGTITLWDETGEAEMYKGKLKLLVE